MKSLDFLKKTRGSALSEFAIMLPLFVMVIYYTLFLNDLAVYKIKALDVSRYVVFAFADIQGSTYSETAEILAGAVEGLASQYLDGDEPDSTNTPDDGSKRSSFQLSKRLIEKQTELIWGRLQPTDAIKTGVLGAIFGSNSELDLKVEEIRELKSPKLFESSDMSVIDQNAQSDSSALTSVLSGVKDMYDTVLNKAGFNVHGMVTATVSVKIPNRFVLKGDEAQLMWDKKSMYEGTSVRSGLTISNSLTMMTDSWKLEDGRSVYLARNNWRRNIDKGNWLQQLWAGGESPFHEQISRMWLGTYSPRSISQELTSKITAADNSPHNDVLSTLIGNITEWLFNKIPCQPFSTKVVSLSYSGDADSGKEDIFDRQASESDGSNKKFHTIPMVEDGNQPTSSEYYKTFQERGPYFMGCKQQGVRNCMGGGQAAQGNGQ